MSHSAKREHSSQKSKSVNGLDKKDSTARERSRSVHSRDNKAKERSHSAVSDKSL